MSIAGCRWRDQQEGLLFCIFDDEKNQGSLQIFDISFAVFNNIFFMQVCCSVVYWWQLVAHFNSCDSPYFFCTCKRICLFGGWYGDELEYWSSWMIIANPILIWDSRDVLHIVKKTICWHDHVCVVDAISFSLIIPKPK